MVIDEPDKVPDDIKELCAYAKDIDDAIKANTQQYNSENEAQTELDKQAEPTLDEQKEAAVEEQVENSPVESQPIEQEKNELDSKTM